MAKPVVIGGIDTHRAKHCSALIDEHGRLLAVNEFAASEAGYRQLVNWMREHGDIVSVGVEGTGSYGAGVARHLEAEGVQVFEVPRPDRRLRRTSGKSDPIDAEAAARMVLAGRARLIPKGMNGPIEAVRVLRVARNGAVKAKTAAVNSLRSMIVTAPEELRQSLPVSNWPNTVIASCARLRPDMTRLDDPVQATKLALRTIARRAHQLVEELRVIDGQLRKLIEAAAPTTIGSFALGTETAGALLVAIGDNPDRLRSEAAFARLCGVAPIPASSGKTNRHRLHRGGDRAANQALHIAVVVRMRYCQRTRAYVRRRTADGLSKQEIIRCLKRYLAREMFHCLRKDYALINA